MVQNNHMYMPAKWQKMSSGVGEFMAKCPLRGHPRRTWAKFEFEALVNGSDWFPFRNQIDTAKTSEYAENYSTYKRASGDMGFPRFLRGKTDYYYYI